MRTRSEWFLGDGLGACGEGDEHDEATCDGCCAKGGSLDHYHGPHPNLISVEDEIDYRHHHLMAKRPVTQLFESTCGFGLPESERERNGQEQATGTEGSGVNSHQRFSPNMFGTLPNNLSSSASCRFDVVDNINNNSSRLIMHRHTIHRIDEEISNTISGDDEDEDDDDKAPRGGDRICLIADTHDAPSIPRSPYSPRKRDSPIDRNNNFKSKEMVHDRNRFVDHCDEITIAAASSHPSLAEHQLNHSLSSNKLANRGMHGGGGGYGNGGPPANDNHTAHNNNHRHDHQHHHLHHLTNHHNNSTTDKLANQNDRGDNKLNNKLNPYLTKSHDDLSTVINRNRRQQRNNHFNNHRSSSSLNQGGGNSPSNDNKLMVLFKILDFIF